MTVWTVGATPKGATAPTRTYHAAFDDPAAAVAAVQALVGPDEIVLAGEKLSDGIASSGIFKPGSVKQWLGTAGSPRWDDVT